MNINKKTLLSIIAFISLFAIVSIVYFALNPQQQSNSGNPGGTGGDYFPKNTISITNSGVLYDYIGSSNMSELMPILQVAVLYNVSVSNNPEITPDYTQIDNFNENTAKLYKGDAQYNVTIDGDAINSPEKIPWHYSFSMSTDDGRQFVADINVDPDIETRTYSIKRL